MDWLLVMAIGLVAGTLSGIVGFGTTIMLLPALVWVAGPREAVPIMAVTALLANVSRVAVWWRHIRWPIVGWFSLGAAPGAAVGARLLLTLEPRWVDAAMGLFLLCMIPARRRLQAAGWQLRPVHFLVIGAPMGLVTGLVASTGPVNTPFFLAAGLVKGAFLATEALSSLGMYAAKIALFRQFGALPWPLLARGLLVGSAVMAGSWLARAFVLRLDPARFRVLMEAMMLGAGLILLADALH